MRRYCRHRLYVFLLVLVGFSFGAARSSAGEEEKAENKLSPQRPRYELKLNLNEYSVLNSSMIDGLKKYGGGAEFSLRMAKEGEEIVWTVTITNPKLMEVLDYWTAEKSAELVKAVDVHNLDAKSKLALATMKSLNERIAYARENPVYDPVRLSGLVLEEDGRLFIEGKQGKYEATGNHLEELGERKSKPVVAVGHIKVEDQIEVIAFLETKVNTLELFVMSMCPYAKIAEKSVLDFLETHSMEPKPELEVHYIFYKRNDNGKPVFTSMHGEKEIDENLVQMVIRDDYPWFYHDYLRERISNYDAQWAELAKVVGMSGNEIIIVKQLIERDRDSLIQKEYDYVTGTYQIYDGSPSYVWECERIVDIRSIEIFKELGSSLDKCSDETE